MDNYNDPFYGNDNNNDPFYGNDNYNSSPYGNNNNQNFGNHGNFSNGKSPNGNRGNSTFLKTGLPIILAFIMLFVGFALGFFVNELTMTDEERLSKWIMDTIDKNYLYDLTDEERAQILAYMGYGAVVTLDQYSDFFAPADLDEMNDSLDAQYRGLGISFGQIIFDEKTVDEKIVTYLTHVYGPSPAYGKLYKYDVPASLTVYFSDAEMTKYVSKGSGSYSKTIEFIWDDGGSDEYATLLEIYYAINAIPLNVTFELSVKRGGLEGSVIPNILLSRQAYTPLFVEYKVVDNASKTAMITLQSFMGDNVVNEMKNSLSKFKNDNMQNLILDLRDNGGGSVGVLEDIAAYFVTDSKNSNKVLIGYAVTKSNKTDKYYSNGNYYNDYDFKKIVILFNDGTASASEALVGAMIDNGTCAYTVGVTSYGKGIRQGYYAMPPNYNYYLKLTDAYMYWPSGECIDGKGINPEKSVPTGLYSTVVSDLQIQAALTYIKS